jgi:hypothetical protein
MRVTPTDYVPGMVEHAEHIRALHKQELDREIDRSARHAKERLTKRQHDLELDKVYFEKGLAKARLLKGTNVDVYV